MRSLGVDLGTLRDFGLRVGERLLVRFDLLVVGDDLSAEILEFRLRGSHFDISQRRRCAPGGRGHGPFDFAARLTLLLRDAGGALAACRFRWFHRCAREVLLARHRRARCPARWGKECAGRPASDNLAGDDAARLHHLGDLVPVLEVGAPLAGRLPLDPRLAPVDLVDTFLGGFGDGLRLWCLAQRRRAPARPRGCGESVPAPFPSTCLGRPPSPVPART